MVETNEGAQYSLPEEALPGLVLSESHLKKIHDTHAEDELRSVFEHVNQIRQVGTPQHENVSHYIAQYLTNLDWNVEWDNFTDSTPLGLKTFRNIIATCGPPSDDYLVLACHYDSKKMDNFEGATDSAMPCSIMLRVATSISAELLAKQDRHLGIRLMFFDGEEAFESWTEQDSLYGSRHLAEKWSRPNSQGISELSRIRLFVLLDLIGTTDMQIPQFYFGHASSYETLKRLESSMGKVGLLRQKPFKYFDRQSYGTVEDDQKPFYTRGVPILHLISLPFPSVWHSVEDSAANIDWSVSMDMLRIMDAFVRSYLHLV